MKKLISITLFGIILISFVNFLKYPEMQSTTLKYQLKNDIKSGNTTAIDYFAETYYSKNKDLFDDNFETYFTAVENFVENVDAETELEIEKESLGIFEITAYCPCEKCCGKSDKITASGKIAAENHTIAMDKKYKYGTKIEIDGIIYTVEDRGGKIKGNKVDIFFENHDDALKFGKQKKEIFLIKGEN